MWKDTTTRSRNEPNAPADTWSYENKLLRISVVIGHRNYPGEWIMHCFSLGFDTFRMRLGAEISPEEAQATAFNIIRNRLTAALNSLPEE